MPLQTDIWWGNKWKGGAGEVSAAGCNASWADKQPQDRPGQHRAAAAPRSHQAKARTASPSAGALRSRSKTPARLKFVDKYSHTHGRMQIAELPKLANEHQN